MKVKALLAVLCSIPLFACGITELETSSLQANRGEVKNAGDDGAITITISSLSNVEHSVPAVENDAILPSFPEKSEYQQLTLATLPVFPAVQGNARVLNFYNDLSLSAVQDICFYNVALQNVSIEFNAKFHDFGGGRFTVALRENDYSKALGPNVANGYGLGVDNGSIWLSKNGNPVWRVAYYFFELETDYRLEFAAVDLDEERTWVYFKINGATIFSEIDDAANQHKGAIAFGVWGGPNSVTLTSADSKAQFLKAKKSENETDLVYSLYFDKAFCSGSFSYPDFSLRNLNSLLVNGKTVFTWNEEYARFENGELAVDLAARGGVITVTIAKQMVKKIDSSLEEFQFETLTILETNHQLKTGLEFNTGFLLANTYNIREGE